MSKRSPRLLFTDEEMAAPELKKAIRKADKRMKKLEKAEAKIPKKTVKRKQRTVDPQTGTVTTRLSFEEVDKKRPPSKLTHALRDAPGAAALSAVHREIREHEQDNVGVESAHGVEQAAERAVRLAQHAHRSHKEKPYRRADRAEAKADRANLRALDKTAQHHDPQFSSNPYSRWQQKQAIKREYAAAKAGKSAGNTVKASEATAKAARKAAENTKKAGEFIARHKKGFLIVGGIAAMLVLILCTVSSCSLLIQGGATGVNVSTYPSEDADMLAAEAQYCAMEAELQQYLDTYESTHDYDEYHFELDDIEHDPYVLISAITALKGKEWTISEVGGVLEMLFEKQYILTETVTTETRYRTETRTGYYTDAEGNLHSYEYTVREDILMSMEELTLSEAETRALLLSPSPMAILYDKFSDLETGYMDTIRDSIEDTAKDEAKKLRELPVYPYPADHAREQGELDVYRASFRANVSCKDAIEAAIRDNYRDNRLDTAAVGQVAEQFGQERMLYVLAATVRHFDYDGRISRDNKRWANTIPVYENKDGMDSDRSVQFVVSSHPGLTDLFLTQARQEQRLRQPLTADEIKAEAARLLGKLQEPVQPNSPGGTHFMAEVSRDFMERAGAKDTAALQKLLPFSTLALTTLKDCRGVYALIGKDEDRSQSLRRPSVRSKLQQASAEQKQPAAKKKDLEL